jgi:dTDP-4-amino-4,6-dideoxygalactose transaminase
MHVPFVDLATQVKEHKDNIFSIVKNVFDKGLFIGGEEVSTFENNFASYIGTKHCVSLNSGTDALIYGTRALELSTGDEIIFPANTYYATLLAANANNIKSVLCEASSDDFGYDLQKLKKLVNSRTKAIMVVHLYGQADKIDQIQSLIKKSGRKIHIIEDACQAHGAKLNSKRVGSYGTFSAFSFYPSKNLGAYGDGGAITTNDAVLEKRIRRIKEYGQSQKYHHESIGFNSRLDTLQAAILSYKLKQLDVWNAQRQKHAKLYDKMLELIPEIIIPKFFSNRKSVYHLYVIRTKQRDDLQKFLKERGIDTQIHYPYPIHLQNAWKSLKYKKSDFPTTETLSNEILSLPMYPELTERQVRYVCISIMNFFYQ